MIRKSRFTSSLVLYSSLYIVGFCFPLATEGDNNQSTPAQIPLESTSVSYEIDSLVASILNKNAAPSLEAKENADFLLVPALIVQESLSSNTVITYPEN